MSTGPVVVFTGPTLTAEAAASRLACVALPPVRQGDVWRAVQSHRPVAIGLIDGVFLHEPAVWHREILWALSQGVHVFGAASMGALRAAELAPFGMRGVGKIFAAYRDGVWPGFSETFEDDDEVAVIHAPPGLGAGALSDAMVDVRDTLLAAEAAGLLARAERDALAHAMKRLPFPERRLSRLAAFAAEYLTPSDEIPHWAATPSPNPLPQGEGEARPSPPPLAGGGREEGFGPQSELSKSASAPRAAEFAAWLPRGAVARKRLDAIALLDELAEFLRTAPKPFRAKFRFQHAQVWEDFLAAEAASTTAEETLVLEELRLRPDDWREAAVSALGRLRATAAAPAPTDGAHRRAFDAFRRGRTLARRADVDAWLAANLLSPAGLDRLMRDEAALYAAIATPPAALDAAIADQLRLTGKFAPLLRRARAKRAILAARPMPPDGPVLDAALTWHADRFGDTAAAPWRDQADYHAAVWREYVFTPEDTT
jgi:hypothetical protein